MKEYILVFAPPGVGLSKAVEKLAGELDAELADIEGEIKKDPEIRQALEAIRATFLTPINMETLTHNLPRTVISKLWKDSVARCLEKLKDSDKSVRILSGHLIYYSGKRSEFYSVVDRDCFFLKAVGQVILKPTCVLLLIDDIYDMYTRLPDLYSPDQIESFLRKLQRDINIDASMLSKDRLSSLTFGWEVRNLLHLLSWRHLEPIVAENLALQLGARFLAWPVKQFIEPIKSYLKNSEATAIYLSHPITDPRNERNESEQWPAFTTNEINKLQETFSAEGITLVMPTGIDELRFQVRNHQYTGVLEARWPLVSAEETKILYSRPDNVQDIHYSTLLKPQYWDFQEKNLFPLGENEYTQALRSEVNAFLQVLVREIEAQISSRDFLFIYHTKGLIVYRPYYAKEPRPTFSGGVDAEVRLWEDIVQLGEQRFIAFVHFKNDVTSMLRSKKEGILQEFTDTVWGLLAKKYYIGRNTIANMVESRGNITEIENILNKANIAQTDRKKLKTGFCENWKQGKIELLEKYLNDTVEVEEKLTGVWILENFDLLRAEAKNIANFLRSGTPRGNTWEEQIESLFPDDLITT